MIFAVVVLFCLVKIDQIRLERLKLILNETKSTKNNIEIEKSEQPLSKSFEFNYKFKPPINSQRASQKQVYN